MKFFLLFVLVVSFKFQSFGQDNAKKANPGKITGRIIDSLSLQPIDYATITVFINGNRKPAGGSASDAKGEFAVDDLEPGIYRVVIDFVGYRTREKKNIVLTLRQSVVSLGNISVIASAQTLAGVTITAQKGLIDTKIDKMVYNAEKDITSQGGVATDLLKKIPMISVDVDGNVELQGNSNIRFLINGKPSSIFGNNLADALQTIPASQIKSIEVITVPGAKYDAEGTGGIINIILKQSKVQGINGNINLSAGSRLENGSMNLNARKNNFGMNTYFSGNAQLSSTTLTSLNRPSYDSTGKQVSDLTQQGQASFKRNGFETGIGFDWTISKHNNLSGGLGYDNFGNANHGFSNQHQYDTDSAGKISDAFNVIHAMNRFRGQSFDWNVNYRKTFEKEGQELNIVYEASDGHNKTFFNQYAGNTTGDSLFSGAQSNNDGKDHETSVQADYVQPLSEKIKLEAGAKIDIRKFTSATDAHALEISSGTYNYDSTQSNNLTYNRHVYAGYGALSFPVGKVVDLKTGIRYERTNTGASFSKTADADIPSYDTWAPSIVISHNFENEQTVKISYTKRIQRPGYRALNPFVNATDPKNLTTGNPLLKPEIGNNYELAYSKSFEKGGSFNAVLFYRRSSQDIQPYLVYHDTYEVGDSVYQNVSVSTPQNIGVENNYGLNLYGSIPFTSKLNVRTNLSLFDRYIQNGIVAGSNITSFNYRVNINLTYQFNNNFVAEAFGNFNSPRNEVQGRFPSFTSYNFAFRKQVWNKKGSFGFTTTNPFNKYVNQTTAVTGQGFVLNSTRRLPFRSFGISFMYKFGKLEFKKEKEEKGNGGGDEGN